MRENNANRFLLRIANLLISIHNGGIFKLLYSPDLKMVLIIFFLLRKSFKRVQCSNESVFHSYMKFCHPMVGDIRFRVRAAPLGDYCLYFSLPRRRSLGLITRSLFVVGQERVTNHYERLLGKFVY